MASRNVLFRGGALIELGQVYALITTPTTATKQQTRQTLINIKHHLSEMNQQQQWRRLRKWKNWNRETLHPKRRGKVINRVRMWWCEMCARVEVRMRLPGSPGRLGDRRKWKLFTESPVNYVVVCFWVENRARRQVAMFRPGPGAVH